MIFFIIRQEDKKTGRRGVCYYVEIDKSTVIKLLKVMFAPTVGNSRAFGHFYILI